MDSSKKDFFKSSKATFGLLEPNSNRFSEDRFGGVEASFQGLWSYSRGGGVHSTLEGLPYLGWTFQVFDVDSNLEAAGVVK